MYVCVCVCICIYICTHYRGQVRKRLIPFVILDSKGTSLCMCVCACVYMYIYTHIPTYSYIQCACT